MAENRVVSPSAGYGRSAAATFMIPSGEDGSEETPVDLNRGYGFLVIKCDDCSGIADDTDLTLQTAEDTDDTPCDLYKFNAPGEQWIAEAIPSTGTYSVRVFDAAGAQLVRPVLSNVTTDDVVFTIYGFDPTVGG